MVKLGNDTTYLRQIVATRYEGYSDWTNDPDALEACKRLEAAGYCRVVWEDERAWRVYQSSKQYQDAISALKGAGHDGA